MHIENRDIKCKMTIQKIKIQQHCCPGVLFYDWVFDNLTLRLQEEYREGFLVDPVMTWCFPRARYTTPMIFFIMS
ncbi:hypothetical protein DRQ36_08360 [bacterium]|nr:MAG: hypothetical protein DRQ36_08360 [bacterium]